jgi:hypothetical protein
MIMVIIMIMIVKLCYLAYKSRGSMGWFKLCKCSLSRAIYWWMVVEKDDLIIIWNNIKLDIQDVFEKVHVVFETEWHLSLSFMDILMET